MQKVKNFLFKNTNTKQTIAKNTFWLFFGEIIGRILKLALVIFATRKLGVEGWGLFSYGLAYVGFFYFLGDFGVNTFLTREMSKDNKSKYKYLSTSFIIKVILLAAFFLFSIILGPHFGQIKLGFKAIFVFSIFFASECLREFGMAINRSLEKMEREGFSKILLNSIITILGVILLLKNANPFSLIIAYTVGSLVSTLYIFWSIRGELKEINWTFSMEHLKTIYAFSWPLIIIGFFSFIYSIDSILLGQMKSATEVGLYSSPQRLVQFTTIIPGFIATSLFPILSKRESKNEDLSLIFEKIMVIVLGVALPITLGGIFFSHQIILLILGPAYLAAVPVLRILMVSILACFPDLILNNLIYSKNLQKIFLKTTSFGLIINLCMNLYLIPRYGAIGAAISTTTSQLVIMGLNWKRLKKFVPFVVFPKLGNICLASIFMGMIILVCSALKINFVINILISIMVYAFSLYALKEPTLKEILSIIKKD